MLVVRWGWSVKIAYATASDYEYLQDHDRHLLGNLLSTKINQHEIYVVRNAQGLSVGWLRYGHFWDNIPFMNLLWIDELYRGQGGGKQAVLFWETDMRQKGFDLVMTSTLSSEEAQHFFRKLGYRDAGCLLLPNASLEILFMKPLS